VSRLCRLTKKGERMLDLKSKATGLSKAKILEYVLESSSVSDFPEFKRGGRK